MRVGKKDVGVVDADFRRAMNLINDTGCDRQNRQQTE
ncbi:MAG: hypothetical protein ACD_39C00683G0002 [uncultured bacterium]|nr:MAG: hypothetical protein ACD_39C00683G0002 [uncultured bacterium]